MPLPWKNTKPNSISRIVSDLHPPSLLLQTGFPTSLVDLFVRNRHRIKKRSLNHTKHEHCPLHAPPPTPSLTPLNSPRRPPHDPTWSAAAHTLDALQQEPMAADVEFNGRPNADRNANANAANSCSTSSLFLVAAKMFLAVIPVLSTEKLVLGITLSAFLLFLLEFLGKLAACFFNPSSIRNRFFSRRDGFIVHGGGEEDPPTNSACNNEIQIVESNSDNGQLVFDEDLQRESFPNREKRLGCCSDLEVEKEGQGQFQVGKSERSRSAKLRAKIVKKLIPKKLLSGKRLKRNKSEKNKMKQETGNMIIGNEQGTGWISCGEEDEAVWEVQQLWKPEEEEEIGSPMMGKEDEEEERNKNLECKFVIVMILLGLYGGRFLALVLTVSGCFMFKLIKG